MERELIEGVINLDKPAGISSARAVARVKWMLPKKTKIGHAGTLDPFATGVLLLLIGRATKSCERLMDAPKAYEATVRFGATTETDDPESTPAPYPDAGPAPSLDQLNEVLPQFTGTILQRPPAFSAMKVGGERAYKLARRGSPIVMEPRPVRVDALRIVSYEWPDLRLHIRCGRGTYIRSLARDLGEALRVGGYLTALRRTQVGRFHAENSAALEQVTAHGVARFLQPVEMSEETISAGPSSPSSPC